MEKIIYQGKEYKSRSELAISYGIKPSTFFARLGYNWSIEEALGIVPRHRHRKGRPIEFAGKQYPSRKELAISYGIKPLIFFSRMRNNWSIEEALGIVPRHRHRKGHPIEFAGKQYPSRKELAISYGIKPSVFFARLGRNWSIEEALGVVPRHRHRKGHPIEFAGKQYPSKKELAVSYGIKPSTFFSRLEYNWSIEEALSRVYKKRNPIEYDGIQYSSKAELARAYDVNPDTFRKRLKYGRSVEEALNLTPCSISLEDSPSEEEEALEDEEHGFSMGIL